MAVLQRFWSRAVCEKPNNQDLGMLGTGASGLWVGEGRTLILQAS